MPLDQWAFDLKFIGEAAEMATTQIGHPLLPSVLHRQVAAGAIDGRDRDTNILIEIRKRLAEVEGAVVLHPQWGVHDHPVGALQELVQLWWFRDLRFSVAPQHLVDSRRKPLAGERKRAREDAVRELETDFLERGGIETVISEDELPVEDVPCAPHAVPPHRPLGASAAAREGGAGRTTLWIAGWSKRPMTGAAVSSSPPTRRS